MGFPEWTLWGMGLAAAAALFFVVLAYLAQSPRQIASYRWLAFRLANRGRSLTGYGLASLLIALGFFLAGIPLDQPAVAEIPSATTAALVDTTVSQPTATPGDTAAELAAQTPEESETDDQSPESGAFLRPPTATAEGSAEGEGSDDGESDPASEATAEEEQPTSAVTAAPTATPSATPRPSITPSPTPSATPTVTPTPTITPTPITGETSVVETLSSTLWVRRTPGGAQLELVLNGDILILEESRVSVGGTLWQQVRTVSGNLGWVQSEFLTNPEGAESEP